MKRYTIPLDEAFGKNRPLCGGKAAALAALMDGGLAVPGGFCLTTAAYGRFIDSNRLRGGIAIELGRKRLDDMRWEEMWDSALRIRNLFLRSEIPPDVRGAVLTAVKEYPSGAPFAVRSASSSEDGSETSYAGLHESFLNVSGPDEILEKIKLVWASLWSDAAISYSRELSLDVEKSSMAVIVQQMVFGEKSGVAFSVSPRDENQAVIEAVYGLNKGLVDGEIEADHWTLDRKSGNIASYRISKHREAVVARPGGVKIEKLGRDALDEPVLKEKGISRVFGALKRAEDIFGGPQDMEWTIKNNKLYLLQARPVTTTRAADEEGRRGFDLSLRRSFSNLKELETRIENRLIPQMVREAEETAGVELAGLTDQELSDEIEHRGAALKRWKEIYWNDFIPFAHGARLFGQVYNDRVKPEDPFEFVDLLSAQRIISVDRNRELKSIARRARSASKLKGRKSKEARAEVDALLDAFLENYGGPLTGSTSRKEEKKALSGIVYQMASKPVGPEKKPGVKKDSLQRKYRKKFPPGERDYADQLLDLARKSYRLRDDDNIYLGRFETNLAIAVEESRRRLGERCETVQACENPEEVMRALRFPDYKPRSRAKSSNTRFQARARQLRGQPAGEGLARGNARVIVNKEDLYKVKRGEILVCDAIDPEMTFVVPLAAGIVERRGGMLIHGAIIAREYGLPCVTGVPGATARIRTGDTITVDGYFGIVTNHGTGPKEL